MKKFVGLFLMATVCVSLALILTGCDSSPITDIVISNEQYTDQKAIDKATQPKILTKDKEVYASVNFIESPKGMKYTAKWLLNNEEIFTEEKEMVKDKTGVIVYTLETDKLEDGTLKIQIIYKNKVLEEKEVTIK